MKEILIFWALGSLVGDLLAERSPLIQQATFWSTNFENIFTWDHGRETSPGTVYDVQYKTYGAVWQNKSECQNITQHFCNLTRETESYTERYYARVRAVVPDCCVSKWIKSLRFCPKEDTVVGEPEVKYIPNIRSIKFIIQPPYTPLRDEDNQTLTVEDIFSQFDVIRYQIIIFCENTQQKWKKTENNKEFEISELDPGTEYNGTIHIKYLGKISKPRKFRVKTLPDNLWMPYLFGVVAFMALLIFGTIYYLIYKYIKRFTTQQPMSLNFKDMSRFQPLTLTVEHILMSHDINKSFQMDPEMKPEQIIQHLQEVLEHQKVFDLPERVYQQQAAMASIQCVATPIGQADNAITIGYAPQVTQNKPPHTLDDKRSTLTYGICVEGTSHSNKINSSTSNMTKSDSVVEGSIGNGHTKVQKGKQHKRGLWESLAQKEPAPELERAEEIQQLLLQGDTEGRPQQLPSFLQERVPTILGERTGSYNKQQPVEFLPPTMEISQQATSDGDPPLSSMPNSLFSLCSSNNCSQDPSSGQWVAWDLLAWTNNQWPSSRFQVKECLSQASEGLKNEPKPLSSATPESLVLTQDNMLLPGLFRDLELKLQWDYEQDENTAVS